MWSDRIFLKPVGFAIVTLPGSGVAPVRDVEAGPGARRLGKGPAILEGLRFVTRVPKSFFPLQYPMRK